MASQSLRYLNIPVLIVCGLIAIAISLILGIIIGALLPGRATAAPDSLSGWVTTVATVVICVLTIVLAIETWRLRAAQTRQIKELMLENIRPNVGIELSSSHVSMNFMNVKITNSGKGIAKKISFEFLDRQDQPANAAGEPIVKVFHKLTMFRLGIQSLGINQGLKSFLFNFIELEGELGAGTFTPYVNIRIKFEDTEGNKYVNAFAIDFAQYEGFSEIGGDSLNILATEVTSIRQQLAKFGTGFDRMAVNVFNADDRTAEQQAQTQRIAEAKRDRAAS
ncbi:hypothetical protein LXA47_27700 [Massilia sp. P8910]|uniref:hypothetical protein n=1 Tax=Massilia antarctica TaxID=2765360 RepID=UPI001E4BD795|nr:hypothetical protein [Massilia antarctica]MCE3607355.1 hypothetical protein [Massilia antarctica]